ncbi:MAG: ribonuclease [Xanthomonadaceae bacterium]|nr:ribonuclease [Xanthomonadaceae bacterium]
MQRTWKTLLPLLVLALVVGYLYTQRHATVARPATSPPIAAPADQPESNTASSAQLPAFLAPEARHTLALIASGGPFPYRQDGVVFGNYEHLLPAEPRGYYHEYTVETPGAHDRGARRIITGGNPPVAYYYTGDHYRSFREFTVSR